MTQKSKQKQITATQYASIVGLDNRAKLYVRKVFSNSETATASEWNDVFINNSLIDKPQKS